MTQFDVVQVWIDNVAASHSRSRSTAYNYPRCLRMFCEFAGKQLESGYSLVPNERGKGYCSEAIKIMVDYLFLSKDIARVQAQTDPGNVASQKVLEKAGFKKESARDANRNQRIDSGSRSLFSNIVL